jgi:DNA-directed RNA polymerase subunit beta
LINTLAVYAKTNNYGFLETPYQVVKKGKVTSEVIYVSAIDEITHTIVQANANVDTKGTRVKPPGPNADIRRL